MIVYYISKTFYLLFIGTSIFFLFASFFFSFSLICSKIDIKRFGNKYYWFSKKHTAQEEKQRCAYSRESPPKVALFTVQDSGPLLFF